jgi:hypothetical protein
MRSLRTNEGLQNLQAGLLAWVTMGDQPMGLKGKVTTITDGIT